MSSESAISWTVEDRLHCIRQQIRDLENEIRNQDAEINSNILNLFNQLSELTKRMQRYSNLNKQKLDWFSAQFFDCFPVDYYEEKSQKDLDDLERKYKKSTTK